MINTIWEDNAGTVLAKLERPRMTPRSCHYAVKYHWFREHIIPEKIELVKIEINPTNNKIMWMDANQSPGTTSIALTGLTTAIFSHLICVEGIGRLYPAAS